MGDTRTLSGLAGWWYSDPPLDLYMDLLNLGLNLDQNKVAVFRVDLRLIWYKSGIFLPVILILLGK